MKQKNASCVGSEINGIKIIAYHSEGKRQYFECVCVCGEIFTTRADGLKAGSVKSCGCLTGNLISNKNRLPNNLGTVNLVLRHYKSNAKKRSLEFLLSLDEFKVFIFGSCFYCGTKPSLSKFTTSQENRRDRELSYNGVDRINSNLGYRVDNCVSCCHICNRAKSDLSVEEFKSWIASLVGYNDKNFQVSSKET